MPVMNFDQRQWLLDGIDDEIELNRKNTVDLPVLNAFENHYVFVYGTLKLGQSRASALSFDTKRNQFCGNATTVDPDYEMVISPTGHFPVVLENTGNTTQLGRIFGQLWLVKTKTILDLDRIEANGQLFFREYRTIKLFSGEEVPAYMYLGVSHFWRNTELIEYPITGNTYNYTDMKCAEVIKKHETRPSDDVLVN